MELWNIPIDHGFIKSRMFHGQGFETTSVPPAVSWGNLNVANVGKTMPYIHMYIYIYPSILSYIHYIIYPINVGKTMPCLPSPSHHDNRWYKPFPVMAGL